MPREGEKKGEGGRETSEGDVANGAMVGVWMDGRGQIKGGRRREVSNFARGGGRGAPVGAGCLGWRAVSW